MMIWYKNFIVVENRDKELELTISICDTPRQRDSVSSMDTDLDSIIEDFQNGFDDVIENLVNVKVYSSKEALEDDIKNGKLKLYAEAQYIDSNKCIPWYSRTSVQKVFLSHKEYFESCASAVSYCMEYPSGIRRFEIYGDMTWEKSLECRCELSDYDHMHERYKFGDIVKFKYPIYGYSKGIITSVAEPESGADIYISRLYDVFCGENTIISCDDFDGIHHDDIEAVIGTDKEAARRAVKELFPWMYIEEYRKEVDLL